MYLLYKNLIRINFNKSIHLNESRMKSFISSKRNQLQSVLCLIFPLEICILIVNMIYLSETEESRSYYESLIHYRGQIKRYIVYKHYKMDFRPTFKYMFENSNINNIYRNNSPKWLISLPCNENSIKRLKRKYPVIYSHKCLSTNYKLNMKRSNF